MMLTKFDFRVSAMQVIGMISDPDSGLKFEVQGTFSAQMQ